MDWLARWARDRPDAPFLVRGRRTVTFHEAAERVGSLAGGLRTAHSMGSRLGVEMAYDVDALLTALAVPAAGMVLVPLPAGQQSRHEALAELAGLDAVLAVGDPLVGAGGSVPPDPEADHSVIFTSGSTGAPRAVRITWANIEASAAATAEHLDHDASDRWLAVLPLHHIGGLSILLRSARAGSAVVLAGPFDARRTIGVLHAGDVTLGSFVSSMVEAIIDAGLGVAPGFRHGLVGGGPASRRALSVSGLPLLASYGMTETASQVAAADPADPDPDRLVVLNGAAISIDETGRIAVDGPMVSPGDLGGPARRGALVTGDLGGMHGDRLEVIGRADDVIVTGGENVMPQQLEELISRVPGAGAVAVVGIPDPRWGSIVAVAYTGAADASTLESAVRATLASHEVPRRWRRVGALPLLGIGKVDRAAVTALFD